MKFKIHTHTDCKRGKYYDGHRIKLCFNRWRGYKGAKIFSLEVTCMSPKKVCFNYMFSASCLQHYLLHHRHIYAKVFLLGRQFQTT